MLNQKFEFPELHPVAAATLSSGQTLQVVDNVGVVAADAVSGDVFTLKLLGQYELAKATGQAWTHGTKLYWHTTNLNWTSIVTGAIDVGATAGAVAANSATVGFVNLPGVSQR